MSSLAIERSGSGNDERKDEDDVAMKDDDIKFEDIPFTSDEDLKRLRNKDLNVSIVGYVDEIIGSHKVGPAKNLDLMKFFINNNSSKRVEVCIWNDLIKKYENNPNFSIATKQILYLENLRCKEVPESSYRNEKNLVPFELAVTTSTGIELLGMMKETPGNAPATDVDFTTIMKNLNKKVSLTGYLKSIVRLSTNPSGNQSYGLSSLTDGHFKVTLKILQIENNKEIKRGTSITVTGRASVLGSDVVVTCQNYNDVTIDEETKKMELKDLLRGIRSPALEKDELSL